jgi:ABC-type iron transport system FetAB permease component
MVVVGGWTAADASRTARAPAVLFRYATLAVLVAGVVGAGAGVRLRHPPPLWYEARLLIPISGMILSNG